MASHTNESRRERPGWPDWELSDEALWLVNDPERDTTPRLYIIPPPEVIAEILGGPEDGILDQLNTLCRDHGMPTKEEYTALGLLYVQPTFRRFFPGDGFYVA